MTTQLRERVATLASLSLSTSSEPELLLLLHSASHFIYDGRDVVGISYPR